MLRKIFFILLALSPCAYGATQQELVERLTVKQQQYEDLIKKLAPELYAQMEKVTQQIQAHVADALAHENEIMQALQKEELELQQEIDKVIGPSREKINAISMQEIRPLVDLALALKQEGEADEAQCLEQQAQDIMDKKIQPIIEAFHDEHKELVDRLQALGARIAECDERTQNILKSLEQDLKPLTDLQTELAQNLQQVLLEHQDELAPLASELQNLFTQLQSLGA